MLQKNPPPLAAPGFWLKGEDVAEESSTVSRFWFLANGGGQRRGPTKGAKMIKRRKSRRETTIQTTQFAKYLRTSTTPAERLLWSRLRRNTLGVHFRRQAPLGKSILDFYCVKSKLAVEVDGDI